MIHVVVDAYSRFADVEVTKSTTGEELLPKLDKLWATHGIPAKLVSDNGPPYKSREFRKYCKKMGIKHRPITETHPQSNGIAERFVKRIVKLILTAKTDGKDPRREVNKFVMGYNSATHSSTGKAPVDLLMNRSVRTLLPGLPQPLDEDRDRQVRETDRTKKEYNKEYKDRRTRAKEKKVRIGDEALIKQKKTSIKPPFDPKPFQVKSVSKSRVNLERDDGKKRKRHLSDIKILKKRPAHLQKSGQKRVWTEEIDVDIDVCGPPIPAVAAAAPAAAVIAAAAPAGVAAVPEDGAVAAVPEDGAVVAVVAVPEDGAVAPEVVAAAPEEVAVAPEVVAAVPEGVAIAPAAAAGVLPGRAAAPAVEEEAEAGPERGEGGADNFELDAAVEPGPQVRVVPPPPPPPLRTPPPPPPPPGAGNAVLLMQQWENERRNRDPPPQVVEREEQEQPPPLTTRSGRVSRPPARYGEMSEEEERDTSRTTP